MKNNKNILKNDKNILQNNVPCGILTAKNGRGTRYEDHPHGILGWTDEKSIVLTKFLTLAAAAGCVVMTLCGPVIVRWVMESHGLY